MLQQALPSTPVKHVVVASLGDMLGSDQRHTGQQRSFATSRRMVPARYSPPDSVRFNDVLAAGREVQFADSGDRPRVTSHSCNTRAAPRALAKGAMLLHRNLVANMLQVEALESADGRCAAEDSID